MNAVRSQNPLIEIFRMYGHSRRNQNYRQPLGGPALTLEGWQVDLTSPPWPSISKSPPLVDVVKDGPQQICKDYYSTSDL